MKRMLLLSGAMGAGKTAVAAALEARDGFQRLSTSGYLRQYGAGLGSAGQRLQLQDLGDCLDEETDYRWVVDDVARPALAADPAVDDWLLDAARKPRQVQHFRSAFGPVVRLVHLTAPEPVLRERYKARQAADDTPYGTAIAHANEVAARSLLHIADVVIDTSINTPDDVVALIQTLWETQDV